MKKTIITLVITLVAYQYIYTQNITVRDSILTYLDENSKTLDKIEGIWDLNVVRTLYKNDSIIGQEFDENRSQWGIIRENESTFKVVDINNLKVDDKINDIEASFEKVLAKNTYFYRCHFKNIDWLKIAIADFWNERTIHYSYYVSKSYMKHIYGPNYDPTLQLHWEFYWVKNEESNFKFR